MEFKIEKTVQLDKVRFSLWITRHEAIDLQTHHWYMFTELWSQMAKEPKISKKLLYLATMCELLEGRDGKEEDIFKEGKGGSDRVVVEDTSFRGEPENQSGDRG